MAKRYSLTDVIEAERLPRTYSMLQIFTILLGFFILWEKEKSVKLTVIQKKKIKKRKFAYLKKMSSNRFP